MQVASVIAAAHVSEGGTHLSQRDTEEKILAAAEWDIHNLRERVQTYCTTCPVCTTQSAVHAPRSTGYFAMKHPGELVPEIDNPHLYMTLINSYL